MINRDKKIRRNQYVFLVVFLLMHLNMIGFFAAHIQPFRYRMCVEQGTPFAFVRDEEYWGSLSDYCIREDYVYLLYGNKGILKIYNSEGKYLCSYAFLDKGPACHLNVRGTEVFLSDQGSDYYVFEKAQFCRFFETPGYAEEVEMKKTFLSMEEKRSEGGKKYSFRYNCTALARVDESGTIDYVLRRPVVFALCQGLTPLIILGLCMAILANLKRH